MSTTVKEIKEGIELLKRKNIRERVKVMVGGAPITPGFALDVGADGFAPDGVSAAKKAWELMGVKSAIEVL